MAGSVQIILGSKSDRPICDGGLGILEEFGVSHSLRVASAHRTPELVQTIMNEFDQNENGVYMCVAGMSAHLAGVVAAHTVKPVVAVPVYRAETAGFDSLLSMGQMPKGIPVATMGFGKHGFLNGALLAIQILAQADRGLAEMLKNHRVAMQKSVTSDDEATRIEFKG